MRKAATPMQPAQAKANQVQAQQQTAQRFANHPTLKPAQNTYGRIKEQHEAVRTRKLDEAGYNSDGSQKPLTNLAENKTFQNFSNNIALPVIEYGSAVYGSSLLSLGGKAFGRNLIFNGAKEFAINGREADFADILTGSLPGMGGFKSVGAGALLDWSPLSQQRGSRNLNSILLPNTPFTSNKGFGATLTDGVTGSIFEGLKLLPKKTIPNLSNVQLNIIDLSNDVSEKVVNKTIKSGLDSQK